MGQSGARETACGWEGAGGAPGLGPDGAAGLAAGPAGWAPLWLLLISQIKKKVKKEKE